MGAMPCTTCHRLRRPGPLKAGHVGLRLLVRHAKEETSSEESKRIEMMPFAPSKRAFSIMRFGVDGA